MRPCRSRLLSLTLRQIRFFAALTVGVAVLVLGAPAASAHPLNNFSINQYHGLVLHPDRVVDQAVVDSAEIPTLQQRGLVDSDGDGRASAAERGAYAARECAVLRASLSGSVGHQELRWTSGATAFEYLPGEQGLAVGRLACTLTSPAVLDRPSAVTFATGYQDRHIGWREITATGRGVRMVQASVAEASISDGLRAYPNDLLSSPLNQRSAALETEPGDGASPGRAPEVQGVGFVAAALEPLNRTFGGLLTRDMSVGVGLGAIGLSILLGASHAALPGHGKTVMAAYLVGRNGGLGDALVVGATVTATHTAGVLAMGLLLSATAAVSADGLLAWLGVVSGALITGIGLFLLRSSLRIRRENRSVDGRGHAQGHRNGHGHGPVPDTEHDPALVAAGGELLERHPGSYGRVHAGHGHGHGHGHRHAQGAVPFTRRGLVGLGAAGGLVPGPSALIVLLGAIALGRTWFGVSLVLGYGVGMAAALMAAGLLLVRLRDRADDLSATRSVGRIVRVSALMPVVTAGLVIAVGLALMVNDLPQLR